jgi:hypothetical protein
LRHCILKKIYYHRRFKKEIRQIYSTVNFPTIGHFLKTTVKPDRFRLLNSIQETGILRWKYLPIFFTMLSVPSGHEHRDSTVLTN